MTLNQDEGANKAVYGKQIPPEQIIGGAVPTPPGAKPLTQVLTKYSPKGI
jgi:lipid-binding SYLF domain-containing protein